MAQQLTPTLRNEYVLLWESCLVKPNRVAAASSLGAKVNANRARYQTVGKPLGVPWFVVGAIHALESGLDFTRHLHNGDPLTARTTHVPAGRPRTGQAPFTWEESAADALALTGVAGWKDWSVAGLLYRLEAYNGFGYRNVKPTIPTPYLWSFSNHYARGKFVG